MLQNVPEGRDPVKMLNSMSLICSRRRQNSLASQNPLPHFTTTPTARAWQAAKIGRRAIRGANAIMDAFLPPKHGANASF